LQNSLRTVQLVNFRGFRDHKVALSPTTVLVGQNNAGKSTFIDALRILAIAVRRARTARYISTPEWLSTSASAGFGYRISFETLDFDFANIQYNHNRSEPAALEAIYVNGSRVRVWLGQTAQENFCQVTDPFGQVASSGVVQAGAGLTSIYVMPPVQSLTAHEKRISKTRVTEFAFGRLASRHFRNQLAENAPAFRAWCALLRETWPTVAVSAFDTDVGDSGSEFSLILREGPFASEAAWVGGGLQAWMQILWFLCRTPQDGIAVLDEPDIFLHADVQRKLIKLLGQRQHHQIVLATHSSEIISDVSPETITVVRKRERSSFRPLTKAKLQDVIDSLGSKHNLQLSKLSEARKILVFEGDDQKFLTEVAYKLGVEIYDKLIKTPAFELTGVSNWHQALGAAKALRAASDGEMPVHLVIDRDYRSQGDLAKIAAEAAGSGLILHVLERKEIENYFVTPACLSRLIERRSSTLLSLSVSENIIMQAADECKASALEAIADQWQYENRGKSASTAFHYAQSRLDQLLNENPITNVVGGKNLISKLSEICQTRFQVSFGPMALCKIMLASEYPPDLQCLVRTLA
jgi:hypothetical protein